jgi:hypothetical protein
MPNKFSSGKFAIAQCDRCDFRFKLVDLKTEIIKTKPYRIKVCNTCWDPDHPQLQLGMYPVNDPQAVREPRRDNSYYQSGFNGLQISNANNGTIQADGTPGEGSRQIQWGWNPVGMKYDGGVTPNDLLGTGYIGIVTVGLI